MEPTLLERAYKLIADPPRLSDYEGDGGVHPNDFRGVVDQWIEDYQASLELSNIIVPTSLTAEQMNSDFVSVPPEKDDSGNAKTGVGYEPK